MTNAQDIISKVVSKVPDAQVIRFPVLSVPAAAGAPPDEQLGLF